jgi:hypothetical protein
MAKLPTTLARWNARRIKGVELSSKTGGEIGPKKLMADLSTQHCNERLKCQDQFFAIGGHATMSI